MHHILSFIHYELSRVLRKPRTRGFGVQSPFAYHFIRYVIAEKWPYYAYEDLKMLHMDEHESNFCRLLLRFSNYIGKQQWLFVHPDTMHRFSPFIKAGNHRSDCVLTLPGRVSIAVLNADDPMDEILRRVSDDSVMILLNLRTSTYNHRALQRALEASGATVCFDLYHEAIIFFSSKLHRHCYKVNG